MSQRSDGMAGYQYGLLLSHNSTRYPITLSLSNPTITALTTATIHTLNLPITAAPHLTFHYCDDDGDTVRMDTTAELAAALRERSAVGERLMLVVGVGGEDGGVGVGSDVDSDSDGFVRVEATDFMASQSPRAATTSAVDPSFVPAQPPQATRVVSEPQADPAASSVDEPNAAEATPPSQPASSLTAATPETAQPAAAQPAGQPSSQPTATAGQPEDAKQDEKQQPQLAAVQLTEAPKQSSAAPVPQRQPLPASPPQRRCKQAQAPAFVRPFIAAFNSQLRQSRLLVDRVGHGWLRQVRSAGLRGVVGWRVSLVRGVRRVRRVVLRPPGVSIAALVLALVLLLGAVHVVSPTGFGRETTSGRVQMLEKRLDRIERQQQALLHNLPNTDAFTALTQQLSFSNDRLDTLELQLQQQQDSIDWLHNIKDLYLVEIEQLQADLADVKRTAEQTSQQQQQWTGNAGDQGRPWQQKTAQRTADFDLFSAPYEWASEMGTTLEDDILTAVFGSPTPGKEQSRPEKQQPSSKHTESRRAKKASSSPSAAVWAEPSRHSASSAQSSPSSAQSCSYAGSTYACTSASSASSASASSSAAVSSSYDTERKSARAERAERRERRKQEREKEATDSVWSISDWATAKPAYNPPAPTKPTTTTSTATTSSTPSAQSSSSSSRSSSHSGANHKSDRWSTGKKGGQKDKLKGVGKKISKALQTVNDAAKRVWKAWKTQW